MTSFYYSYGLSADLDKAHMNSTPDLPLWVTQSFMVSKCFLGSLKDIIFSSWLCQIKIVSLHWLSYARHRYSWVPEEGSESTNPLLHTTERLTEHGTWTPHIAYQHQSVSRWMIQGVLVLMNRYIDEVAWMKETNSGSIFRIYIQDQFSGLHRKPESGNPTSILNQ